MLGAPALADTSNFSITSPGGQQEEEEMYFQTVPQDLDSGDTKQGPRLGALIEGPKGKQVGGACPSASGGDAISRSGRDGRWSMLRASSVSGSMQAL